MKIMKLIGVLIMSCAGLLLAQTNSVPIGLLGNFKLTKEAQSWLGTNDNGLILFHTPSHSARLDRYGAVFEDPKHGAWLSVTTPKEHDYTPKSITIESSVEPVVIKTGSNSWVIKFKEDLK